MAVAGGSGVAVGSGSGVGVAGRAVGAAGVRVGRLRKAAAREVGVALAAGAQALNKNTRQKKHVNLAKILLLLIAIPINLYFPSYLFFYLFLSAFIRVHLRLKNLLFSPELLNCYPNHTSLYRKCPREESDVHGIIALARRRQRGSRGLERLRSPA